MSHRVFNKKQHDFVQWAVDNGQWTVSFILYRLTQHNTFKHNVFVLFICDMFRPLFDYHQVEIASTCQNCTEIDNSSFTMMFKMLSHINPVHANTTPTS